VHVSYDRCVHAAQCFRPRLQANQPHHSHHSVHSMSLHAAGEAKRTHMVRNMQSMQWRGVAPVAMPASGEERGMDAPKLDGRQGH
ncbi:MAG: hypothetical protein ACXVCO_15070, partial [Ktedonobacterales bacterium]